MLVITYYNNYNIIISYLDIPDDVVITPTSAVTPTSPVYLEQDDNETVTSSSGKSGSDVSVSVSVCVMYVAEVNMCTYFVIREKEKVNVV